jgi:hypothetical protein
MTKRPTPDVERDFQAPLPFVYDLPGPGPFQLPLLTRVGPMSVPETEGRLEIRLDTERGQEIRIPLTEDAASGLLDLLMKYFASQA